MCLRTTNSTRLPEIERNKLKNASIERQTQKKNKNQRQNSKIISNNFENLNHLGNHCVPSNENFIGVGCRSEYSSAN